MIFSTPILLNLFNRPYETEIILNNLRDYKVPVLYIHCDGPRENNLSDKKLVNQVKELISNKIDWDCELHLMYEENNQGCGKGPYRAMSWFFNNVEEGIILEDDCIPHKDFFLYCQELLEKYRNNNKVGIIGGSFFRDIKSDYSYFFTPYAGIWGWATWKRVWHKVDYNISISDEEFKLKTHNFLKSNDAENYWLYILKKCKEDGINKTYWDYQLHLCLMLENIIHITPTKNLISNIGFNEKATHTVDSGNKYANKEVYSILPLKHPKNVEIDYKFCNQTYKKTFFYKIKKFVKRFYIKYVNK
jgi:hypothetical protein